MIFFEFMEYFLISWILFYNSQTFLKHSIILREPSEHKKHGWKNWSKHEQIIYRIVLRDIWAGPRECREAAGCVFARHTHGSQKKGKNLTLAGCTHAAAQCSTIRRRRRPPVSGLPPPGGRAPCSLSVLHSFWVCAVRPCWSRPAGLPPRRRRAEQPTKDSSAAPRARACAAAGCVWPAADFCPRGALPLAGNFPAGSLVFVELVYALSDCESA